ncbi:VOC family protein [Rhodococcus fascians]|nr:VOC family protein [Rhodococcus fascians]MBY3998556.1 VOC family protein [Rhodococcus fascians]MBY4004716.1 VOC family protein [Rhodococcus fascians]MBY4009368.1 VOC family protein [Rhodococcus fascians]MBY4019877.1 VOC family protein [Rhodococcus fascians]
MQQQVHSTTLATADLDAARSFYCDGLGWTPLLDVPGEILFFQIGPGAVLGLYDATAFDGDLGRPPREHDLGSVTLAHNVDDAAAVDAMFAATLAAGATPIKTPQRTSFGGYHAHIADPNGVIWEICHNPGWSVDDDGTVRLT